MKAATKQTVKRTLKAVIVAIAVVAVTVAGYRYYNKPVQVWNATDFEARIPDRLEVKGQGQKYWLGQTKDDGFYITDATVQSGDKKVYCVSGGVTSDTAVMRLGDSTAVKKNGYFTHCARLTVNDKRQLTFSLVDGNLQVYRVDRKR